MGSKGGGTTVMLPQAQAQTTTVAPNPVALAGYANVVGQAQNLQAENRGFTPDQQQAFNQVQQLQGVANPWINSAGEFAQQGLGAGNALINSGANAGSPQNFGQNINAYMSPYMDDVVKATMANINETNAQQQSQLTGNAIAQGALGGNRVGVAGSELARQQNLTNNATLAQILQQGYGQAGQNLFQNAGLQMQAGNSLGSLGNQTAGIYSGLGNEALSTGLQGTNALLQTGGMQQALPYQQLGWLSGIINNTGPNMGQTGTQNSMGFTSQYQPQPSLLGSIIGGGVAAAGAFLPKARGGAVSKAHGGGLGEYDPRSDDYDSPVGGGFGAIPEVRPTNAHGLQLPAFLAMQQAHQAQQQQDRSPSFGDWAKAGKGLGGAYDRYADTNAMDNFAADYANEPTIGGGEARGGRVRGYDDGGEVIDDTATNPDPFSDEGGVRAPRSVRNNNPGNLVDNGYTRGLPGYKGSDGKFAIFESPEAGAAAQDGNLQGYGRKGFNTPAAIIGRWAPAEENGVEATNNYIKHVSNRLGVDPNTPLDLNDPNVRSSVNSAMADWEARTNGQTRALAYASPGDGGGGLGAINSAAPIEGRSADTGVAPPDAEPGFLERLGVPKISPDTRAALISAGLGMMASKSHWLGPAIGEGGLAGVKAYYENQQNARQNALAQSNIGYKSGLLGQGQQRTTILGQEANTHATNVAGENMLRAAQAKIGLAGLNIVSPAPGGMMVRDASQPLVAPRFISYDQIMRGDYGTAAPAPSGVPSTTNAPPAAASVKPTPAGDQPSTPPTAPAQSSTATPPLPLPTARGAAGTMNWQPKTSVEDIPPEPGMSQYMPPNAAGIGLNSDWRKTDLEMTQKQLEPIRVNSAKAQEGLRRIDEMERLFDDLPKSGFLAPGAGAEERLKIAKAGNALASTFGLQTHFDESATADMQQLQKDTFNLATELLNSKFGGQREAGFIINQARGANPGIENTLTAARRLLASTRETLQYNADYGKFMDSYANKFQTLGGAQNKFNELNPVERYNDRAVLSTIDPRELTGRDNVRETRNGPIIPHAPGLYDMPDSKSARRVIDKHYGKGAADIALRYRPLTVRVPTNASAADGQ